jgi:hypothetical protein
MKPSAIFTVLMAVVILALLSGCTGTTSPPVTPAATTPMATPTPMTPVATPTPTTAAVPTPDSDAVADMSFNTALETCYATTPVITNGTSRVAFVNCLQNAPDPKGGCAVNYKSNVQRYLKDDDTTAGYNRMNSRIQLARDAYSRNLTYNYVLDQAEPCSPQPTGFPV